MQDIMSTPVETIAADATIADARGVMKRRRIRHLVVTDKGQLLGVLSSRDLAGEPSAASVTEVMARDLATAGTRDSVRVAANRMRGRTVGCLPVIDGGRVVGIVTTADLLELIGRGVERPIARSTRWTLAGRGPRKRRPTEDRQRMSYSR
jgi:acetoin utilization protein AcuB